MQIQCRICKQICIRPDDTLIHLGKNDICTKCQFPSQVLYPAKGIGGLFNYNEAKIMQLRAEFVLNEFKRLRDGGI